MRYLVIGLALLLGPTSAGRAAPTLRVCADPNNLPFSNDRHEGFEDRIAALLAADMGQPLEFSWGIEKLGFLRRTLNAHRCDVVMGVSSEMASLDLTRAYYRSSYVFVWQKSRALHLDSFDDPSLKTLKIGLQALVSEGMNPPPAQAIAERGLGANVVGFVVYDAPDIDSPAGRIIDAVATGKIDVAAVWGPLAGYFAKRQPKELTIKPILADPALPKLTFTYGISIGVRKGETGLRDGLNAALDRHQAEIDAILAEYGVPRIETAPISKATE